MKDLDLKKEMLQMLKKEMMQLVRQDKNEKFGGMLPKKMEKVTVMSDSKEGLKKGLSKAEEILKAKMGKSEESEDESEEMEDEYKCPECEGKEECECDEE